MKEASIEKARAKLGDIVDRVRYTGDPTLITRHGKAAVLITPILGPSDLGAITLARQSFQIRDLADAHLVIQDLLITLDRYLAADQGLIADHAG
jgi:prevent-host-death family protein